MVLTFAMLSFFLLDLTHVLRMDPYNQLTKKERLCFKMDLQDMHVSINVGSLFDSSLKDNGRGRSFQWVELQAGFYFACKKKWLAM